MVGPSRQPASRLTRFTFFVVLAMVLMPVGRPMPSMPGGDSLHAGIDHSPTYVVLNRFGVLTEDDLEPECHDFTIIQRGSRLEPMGPTGRLISFLWTERLHRPPIASA
jgi:hypothetical protein